MGSRLSIHLIAYARVYHTVHTISQFTLLILDARVLLTNCLNSALCTSPSITLTPSLLAPPPTQIDDFLNGKSPLSVAIRVGESVVVVNLHRAKVEEIEVEPPATKRRCIRNRRLSDEMDFLEPVGPPASTTASSATSSLSQPQAPAAASHSGLHHRHHHLRHRHHHRHHHHHHHNSNPSRTSMSVGMGLGSSEEREVGLERDSPPPPPVVDHSSTLGASRTLPTPVHTTSRLLDSEDEPCCSYSAPSSSSSSSSARYRTHSVSRSVQTDPEPPGKPREILKESSLVLPDSGVSMKRKAVMEAISEILKKMYASSEKGRLPGCFKGRFSSEFTCDSDMREILHSKTTMTSYGTDLDEDRSGISSENEGENPNHDKATLSKAKAEENEQMRGKVKELKWKMQQSRAMKLARRKGERSPCGWMEALNCEMPLDAAVVHARTGFCGFKRGFLLK